MFVIIYVNMHSEFCNTWKIERRDISIIGYLQHAFDAHVVAVCCDIHVIFKKNSLYFYKS